MSRGNTRQHPPPDFVKLLDLPKARRFDARSRPLRPASSVASSPAADSSPAFARNHLLAASTSHLDVVIMALSCEPDATSMICSTTGYVGGQLAVRCESHVLFAYRDCARRHNWGRQRNRAARRARPLHVARSARFVFRFVFIFIGVDSRAPIPPLHPHTPPPQPITSMISAARWLASVGALERAQRRGYLDVGNALTAFALHVPPSCVTLLPLDTRYSISHCAPRRRGCSSRLARVHHARASPYRTETRWRATLSRSSAGQALQMRDQLSLMRRAGLRRHRREAKVATHLAG